jgi:hypothetical protein
MGTATVMGLVTAFLSVLALAIKAFVAHQSKEQVNADAITSRDLSELESGMAAVDGMQPGPVPAIGELRLQPAGGTSPGVVHDPETVPEAPPGRPESLL